MKKLIKNKKKLLVIDDELIVREILERILSNKGYEILLADGGKKALNLLKNKKLGLILLDLKMSEVDGMQVLKSIKKKSETLPVIIISAYLSREVISQTKKLGANQCIKKPFDVYDIKKEIKRLLLAPKEEHH